MTPNQKFSSQSSPEVVVFTLGFLNRLKTQYVMC